MKLSPAFEQFLNELGENTHQIRVKIQDVWGAQGEPKPDERFRHDENYCRALHEAHMRQCNRASDELYAELRKFCERYKNFTAN